MNREQLQLTIQTVIDYNWTDEFDDYKANPDDLHIFNALVRLQNWLSGESLTPEQYIADAERQ